MTPSKKPRRRIGTTAGDIADDRLGQLIPGLIASRNVFEYSEEAYASGGGELLPLLVINVSGVGEE